VRVEPTGKRVRAVLGGEVIVDSDDVLYVWESPWYPQYYIPVSDVAARALVPSTTQKRAPSQEAATYFSVRGGDKEAADAAWQYADSPIPDLRARIRFEWTAIDAWFEEDEEVFVHPRDPGTRVQVLSSSRHVRVELDGVTVADSQRPVFLYETHLPRRTYLPKLDIRMDLLTPVTTTTMCPYKGTAEYWSVQTPSAVHADLAWSYAAPYQESASIAGLIAFYDERVDLVIDGRRTPRPETRFS